MKPDPDSAGTAQLSGLRMEAEELLQLPDASRFTRHAVEGFVLDLTPIRESFKPW